MSTRALVLALATSNPIAALWLAALARLEVDSELLRAAGRVYPEECAAA
jgi:hypothetical protein